MGGEGRRGPGRSARRGRGEGGGRRRPLRARWPSPSVSLSPRLGPGCSPRRCVTTPRPKRAGKPLQNFPQTSRRGGTWAERPGWAGAGAHGRPRRPDPGRGRPPWPASFWRRSSRRASATSSLRDPTPPGSGGEGAEPGAHQGAKTTGGGEAGPRCCVRSANSCTSSFSICVTRCHSYWLTGV